MFEQCQQHRRHAADPRCSSEPHQSQIFARVEAVHDDVAPTYCDRAGQHGHCAAHVIERAGINPDVSFVRAAQCCAQPGGIDYRAVRQGGTFGAAGGA